MTEPRKEQIPMQDEITIDGRSHLAAGVYKQAADTDGADRVIVRTYSAGVFVGSLTELSDDGRRARVLNARRIWYWDGAASLSELALRGPSKPQNCKFPPMVAWVELTDIVEVLPLTEKAAAVIDAVPDWTES